jgi:hypothetical protein
VYEEVINNIKPDEAALKALIARITKSRTDANKKLIYKVDKLCYVRTKNKFNNSFSNEELANVTSNELIQNKKTLISTNKVFIMDLKTSKR